MRQQPGEEFTPYQIVVAVSLLIAILFAVLWHGLEAWRLLPGARMISGQGARAMAPTEPPANNPLRDYLSSRTLIVVYFVLYVSFAFARGDGWEYHYVLLAWAISLLSRFNSAFSVTWLAITTGVFLQGIGAYSLRFLWSQEWSHELGMDDE